MVKKLLKEIYFTAYTASGRVELNEHHDDEYGSNPIRILDQFHSQFQLETTKYIDNNNFIRPHHIHLSDDHYLIFSKVVYKCVDLTLSP